MTLDQDFQLELFSAMETVNTIVCPLFLPEPGASKNQTVCLIAPLTAAAPVSLCYAAG